MYVHEDEGSSGGPQSAHRGGGGRRGGGPGGRPDEGHRGGRGRRGGWQNADVPPADDASAWFAEAVPGEWFEGDPKVSVDREEIWVSGLLGGSSEAADVPAGPATESARIAAWRESTRADRIRIARAAEHRYGRKVSWGATVGSTSEVFTHLAVPVMTRLRQPERRVLDTLVEAGVARSRADALAWCVRLVGENVEDWLGELREAMRAVDEVRARGPFT